VLAPEGSQFAWVITVVLAAVGVILGQILATVLDLHGWGRILIVAGAAFLSTWAWMWFSLIRARRGR
jgi:NhaP-type Na+/H+ or K+/H+ antiporter